MTTKGRTAAVIGSGFGGLALAIRLQAAGVRTTLVEKRDRPGGRAYVYEEGRYKFDGGPTVITAPQALEDIFRAAGREMADYIEMIPVKPFYRLHWEDGYVFDYSNDPEQLRSQIAAKNPRDVEGYERFVSYAEDVFREGYLKLGAVPFLDFWSMMRCAPQLMRLQAFRTVYDRVAHFIKDPHLRETFSFHSLLVGGNPFATSSIYTLIHALERKWGVFFPRGGTGALVAAMIRLFEELGGTVRLDCPVSRIRTRDGRVTGLEAEDGWSADFDVVASNADVVHTYDRLLADETKAQGTAAGLKRKRFSMGLVVVYFGVKRRHPQLAHHSVLFGPRYRGLLDDIFTNGKLADDFSLYLHAPTASDPNIAPDGCEAFYVLSPVPHLGKAALDWGSEGPRYRDRILGYLEERYIPGLGADLEEVKVFTPADFRTELNAHVGSAFSLEPILRQSAYFRVHNRDDRIGGLYFVGAGTHPGAGVPGVVASAEATAGLMLQDLGVATTNGR
jgi:phytoene desaturase